MNIGILIHLGWLAAVIAAFVIGRTIDGGTLSDTPGNDTGADGGTRAFEFQSPGARKQGDAADGAKIAATNAAMSSEDMLQAVEALRNEKDPVKRNYLFAQLLTNLTAANAAETYAALRELRGEGDRRGRGRGGRGPGGGDLGRQMGLFFQAWGDLDGRGAVEAALASNESEDGENEGDEARRGPGRGGMESTMGAVSALSRWVRNDPKAAQEWVAGQEDGREKTMLNYGLINGLSKEDPDAATSYVLSMLDAQTASADGEEGGGENRMQDEMARRWSAMIASEQLKKGVDSAIEWAASLPDGDFKGTALDDIAERYAREDITKAAEWVAQFAGEAYARGAVSEIASTMAKEDAQAAADWIMGLPEENQSRALYSTFDDWARTDPTAASEYLSSMDESPAKDRAISGFARELDRENPEAAAAWATAITEEELRNQTMNSVARSWYRTDAEAATQWMQDTGMSEDAQKAISASAARGGTGGRGGGDARTGRGGGQGGRRGR